MATIRVLTSRNRSGIERSALQAAPQGRYTGRWQNVSTQDVPAASVEVVIERTEDNGLTWEFVSRTVFSGELAPRAPAGAPIDIVAGANTRLRYSVDVSGTYRSALDVVTP